MKVGGKIMHEKQGQNENRNLIDCLYEMWRMIQKNFHLESLLKDKYRICDEYKKYEKVHCKVEFLQGQERIKFI